MNIQITPKKCNATLEEIRAVWAVVTTNPRAGIQEMVRRTGVKHTRLNHILKFLEDAGYIEHKPYKTGRKVIIPLVTT